jgi:NAD-dependent protein deacetylase/lipoamidase
VTDNTLEDFAKLIDDAGKIVIFTGAGISTESGIPDFRSPGGVWSKVQPIQFQDFVASQEIRDESWRRRFTGEDTMGKALPNRGHLAVAKLIQTGKATHIITQNVDNLHQNSGVPDEQVIELHGNATYAKCLDCGHPYDLRDLALAFEANGTVHDCEACGGLIKSATVSFGQAMPELEMMRAEEATLECDLFIAIGSSLVVFPAAGFPMLAKNNGSKLVILNREVTELDGYADLVVHDEIGPVLSRAVQMD